MTYQPIVPFGGFAGWAFLQRTEEKQREAFDHSTRIERETNHFTDNIGAAVTVDDLMNDRTLLTVALGAFGLGDDINNKAFIRKVLSDGVLNEDALANKLADKRYYEFSKAFGYGDFSTPSTVLSTFPAEINQLYRDRQFEEAIGNQNEDMRLVLSLERDLTAVAEGSGSEASKWFAVMGNPPLRKVFETALGLPASFGAIDLDKQLEVFQERAQQAFGDSAISQFTTPESQQELIRRFLALSEINTSSFASSGANAALTILQNINVAGALR